MILTTQEKQNHQEAVAARAEDLFYSLPDFHTPLYTNGVLSRQRFTNVDDAFGELTQDELVAIARALRYADNYTVGALLRAALIRVCAKQAVEELDEEDDDEQ